MFLVIASGYLMPILGIFESQTCETDFSRSYKTRLCSVGGVRVKTELE